MKPLDNDQVPCVVRFGSTFQFHVFLMNKRTHQALSILVESGGKRFFLPIDKKIRPMTYLTNEPGAVTALIMYFKDLLEQLNPPYNADTFVEAKETAAVMAKVNIGLVDFKHLEVLHV